MQIKKFEAPTIAEALKLVKGELGPDAIILSTRNHRKGLGLLSKSSVEITAAISEKALTKKTVTDKIISPETKERIQKLPASKQAEIYDRFGDYYDQKIANRAQNQQKRFYPTPSDNEEILQELRKPIVEEAPIQAAQARQYERAQANIPVKEASYDQELKKELQQMKTLLADLKNEQTAYQDAKIVDSSNDEIQQEFQNLVHNGIEKRFASALIKNIQFLLSPEALQSNEKIIDALASELMNSVKIIHPFDAKTKSEKKYFAFVGPTGVGKTTTIAKLASQAILHRNLRVGLINLDCYKISANEQLSTYAKILNIPVKNATDASELERAMIEFQPLDLVLIDTSGRSQRDAQNLLEMSKLIQSQPKIQSILMTSATTRDAELYDVAHRFKVFNPCGLLFSKLDESTTFGCIYNLCLKTKLPLTYFTVGQRVPEDIEPASRERVAALILDL